MPQTYADIDSCPQLNERELHFLWLEFLEKLEEIDERVAEMLRMQDAAPSGLTTSLSNNLSQTHEGAWWNRGLKAFMWPEPFDFYMILLRKATPLLSLAAEKAELHGFHVSRIEFTDILASQFQIGLLDLYHRKNGSLDRAKTEVNDLFLATYELPETHGAVETTKVDGFDLTPPEVSLYRGLQEQGLVFSPQTWIVDQKKPRYRVDFMIFYDGSAHAVEVDGHDWHKTKQQRAYDAARDRFLQMRGIPTIRFTASEVHRDTRACVFELLDCLSKGRGRQP